MLKFHITEAYPCSYIPEKQARSQIAIPDHQINTQTYEKLIQGGFRRSGTHTYRPCCDNCNACLPVRVNVNKFSPNRTQRRAWKRHCHLVAIQHDLRDLPNHFELYQRYQKKRHSSGVVDYDNYEQYYDFLLQSHVNSGLIEFYEDKQLRIVSIIDVLSDGLSSVYTFFDPDVPNASFGTYNILWQIQRCQALSLPYLYLGYWIKENQKMSYKTNFQPLEIFVDGQWQQFSRIKDSIHMDC